MIDHLWKSRSLVSISLGTVGVCPQVEFRPLPVSPCPASMLDMYNVVRTAQLRAAGLTSPGIRHAQGCCLTKLSFGIYSIVRRCDDARHSRIRSFITDDKWIRRNDEHRQADKPDPEFDLLMYKLRASSYPYYRAEDVLIGPTSAVFHELPMYRPPLNRIFVAHPYARHYGPLITRVDRMIPRGDMVTKGKLVLTSPARAALELIPQLGEPAALAALDFVVRNEVFGSSESAASAARFGYPPDTADRTGYVIDAVLRPAAERLSTHRTRALRLIEHASALSESYAESRCRHNFIVLRVDGIEPQVEIYDGDRFVARVDFMHRRSGTIILVDGASKYVQHGFERMKKEADQHNKLVAMGYTIVRFNFHETNDLEGFATKLLGQAPALRSFIRR